MSRINRIVGTLHKVMAVLIIQKNVQGSKGQVTWALHALCHDMSSALTTIFHNRSNAHQQILNETLGAIFTKVCVFIDKISEFSSQCSDLDTETLKFIFQICQI